MQYNTHLHEQQPVSIRSDQTVIRSVTITILKKTENIRKLFVAIFISIAKDFKGILDVNRQS